MDEYYDPMTITPPTRNDARRLGAMLRRYARGGVMYGMAGLKAGKAGSKAATSVITKAFTPKTASLKIPELKTFEPVPTRYAPKKQVLPDYPPYYGSWEPSSNSRFQTYFHKTSGSHMRDSKTGRPLSFDEAVKDVMNALSPTDLRRALAQANRPMEGGITRDRRPGHLFDTYQAQKPIDYITDAVINGDFATHELSSLEKNIRRNSIKIYNDINDAMKDYPLQQRQQMLINALSERNLIVENPYCKSGISYADGTEFRPGNTPLEDFIISDNGMANRGYTLYNDGSIQYLEQLPEDMW